MTNGPPLFRDRDVLLNPLAEVDQLLRRNSALRKNVEASGRCVEQDLILSFYVANIVLPLDVTGTAVPLPTYPGLTEGQSLWTMSTGLLQELAPHQPPWKKPQNRNPHRD